MSTQFLHSKSGDTKPLNAKSSTVQGKRKVWVTRDKRQYDNENVCLWHHNNKPYTNGEIWVSEKLGLISQLCYAEFKRYTGITLKPGEIKLVRLGAEVIE